MANTWSPLRITKVNYPAAIVDRDVVLLFRYTGRTRITSSLSLPPLLVPLFLPFSRLPSAKFPRRRLLSLFFFFFYFLFRFAFVRLLFDVVQYRSTVARLTRERVDKRVSSMCNVEGTPPSSAFLRCLRTSRKLLLWKIESVAQQLPDRKPESEPVTVFLPLLLLLLPRPTILLFSSSYC